MLRTASLRCFALLYLYSVLAYLHSNTSLLPVPEGGDHAENNIDDNVINTSPVIDLFGGLSIPPS